MRSNVVDFKSYFKKNLANQLCKEYKTISEKYVLMIIDELEERGFTIRENQEMVEEFIFLKDVMNLVAASASDSITPKDRKILDNVIQLLNESECD